MSEPLDLEADPVIAIALPNSAWSAIVQHLSQRPYLEVAGHIAQIHMQTVAAFEVLIKAAVASASPPSAPAPDERQAPAGETEPAQTKEALH